MTDLIERVDTAISEGDEPASTSGTARTAAPGVEPPSQERATNRPLHVLFAVAAGGSAVLLFAMASGHLHGLRATVAIVAALSPGCAGRWGVRPSLARPVRGRRRRERGRDRLLASHRPAARRLVADGRHRRCLVRPGPGARHAARGRPELGTTWSSDTSVIGSVVPVAVAALAIGALFATGTPTPAPTHATSATAAPSGVNASTALAEATTVKVPGENSKTFASTLAGNTTEQSENAKWVPLDAADQAVLTQQLTEAYQAAMRFPTVASAKAAHMILAGGMAPGVGADYQEINAEAFKGIKPDGTINALYPASWIYASAADNAPVVGVMYESLNSMAPSGFIGPNDHWHRHSDVCIQPGLNGTIGVPFAADQDVTPQECADVHGDFMKKTVWMVHAWVVPGWESPQGVFSHDNLHIYCPGNTDLTNAIGFCDRQS